ncbi:MAG: aminopeptidase [Bacteroidaceae bacterium]|nr:aminopeptidase [Bacteroidaceae bacterium]
MKKTIYSLLALLLTAGSAVAQDATQKESKKDSLTFTVVKENPITSVKNQNRSGTCWAYSSLGFFEAEALKATGKTFDLCEAFVVENTYLDRATAHVRMHGDVSFSQGGSFYDVLYCLQHYGICPEDAMPKPGSLYGDSLFNHNELDKVSSAYVKALTGSDLKTLSPVWKNGLTGIYEAYIGKLPETFTYEGRSYTPKSFVDVLGLKLDDYVSLTSFTHHPYYSSFAIEVQDNWRWGQSYNLPLDEFMRTMDYAIRQGYTFAWGADVSEPSFRRHEVVLMPEAKNANDDTAGSDQARWIGDAKSNKEQAQANLKNEVKVTPELRQKAYDNWETTDDHGMLIYGLVKDQYGKEYFMMKNSWGDYNKFHGKCYISKAYTAYKTMNILINKKAIPKDIAKKLGL